MRAGARVAGAAVCWLAGAGLAWGQATTFPESLEREPLLVWLQRETDILPGQVVAVTPQALTSIVSTFPAGGGAGPRVVIRAEALSREIVARTGAMSWHVSLSADCEGRRARLGETTGYPERNLLGERKVLRAAENGWRTPEPGTALDHAWRAACERGFAGPFRTPAVALAHDDRPPGPKAAAAPPVQAVRPTVMSAPPPVRVAKPASGPAGLAGLVAQVGAAPSDADAKGLLASLSASLAGHATWVEKADVAGRTWYRAVVGGFADGGEAARFCASLRALGRACFVRPGRPA